MAFDSISPFNMNSKNNDNDNNVSSRQITIDSDSNSNAYGSLTPPLQAAELWRMQQAREEENNSLLQLLSNRQNARQQQSSGSGMPSFNSTNNNNDDPSPSGQQNGGHANGTSFPPSSSLSSSSVNNITTAADMMSNYAAARQSLMNDMNNVRGGGVSSGGLGMDHMNMSNNNSNISNNPFDMNPISLASMRRGMGGTGTGQGGSLGPSSAFTMSSFMNSRLGCDQAMMNGFGGGDSSGDNDNMDNNRGQNNNNINSMNYNHMISGGNGMSGVGSSIGQQQQQQQQQQPSLSDYINNSSLNSDNLPNFETHMNHPFGASGYGGGGLSSSNNLNNNNNINNNMNSFRSSMTSISPGFQSEFLLQQQILHGGGPSSIASSNNMAGSLQSLSSGPDNLSYISSMTGGIGCGLSSGGGFPQEDQAWEDQFKNLRAYQMQFGHCRVPARYKADQKLGRWVMTQRRQFTLLMQGFPSALTTDRIKRLENLGFTWSVRPEPVTTWNSKFQELKGKFCSRGVSLMLVLSLVHDDSNLSSSTLFSY